MSEIKNAIIKRTVLGRIDNEDYFTFYLEIEDMKDTWGTGGFPLSFIRKDPDGKITEVFSYSAMEQIASILNVVGVNTWEELPGQLIRVDIDGDSIIRIGHIIKDKWKNTTYPCDFLESY